MACETRPADSVKNLLEALQTIRKYAGQLQAFVDANASSDCINDNQTVSRLVFNAKESLKSALNSARRLENVLSPSKLSESALDNTVADGGSDQTDEFEDDLANVTTEDLLGEPDCDVTDCSKSSDTSVNLLDTNVTATENDGAESLSCVSGGDLHPHKNPADAKTVPKIDEFGDINFDDDDFSNDGAAKGMEGGDADEMFKDMTPPYAELMEGVDFDDDVPGTDADDSQLRVEDVDDDPANQPDDPAYATVLKKYFGYSKFRPLQWKIINSVLNEKKDNCVIMATGYGKSLCYQFPSVYTQRITVVISPLISLMEDQVLGLQAANIPACLLGSAQSDSSAAKTCLLRGEKRLLYITPEFARFDQSFLQQLHNKVGIDLIAIDEAHCVSQWGYDFRAAYRDLGSLKEAFPKVPFMALTATATLEVRRDICRSLHLFSPTVTCTGFDRPNLYLSVSNKSSPERDLKSQMSQTDSGYEFSSPTIIYCLTKKTTMKITNVLRSLGVSCLPYHAGLPLSARKQAHGQFLKDQVQVVVATVAFGMGIDKPDVRKVIHYGAPKDIESYYQEVGRAGRDNMPSSCHVFYSDGDFAVSRHFISDISSEKFREHKMEMMHKMQQYLSTMQCRRRLLLRHFEGQEMLEVGGTENCCDNCSRRIESSRRQNFLSDRNWQTSESLVPQDQAVDLGKEVLELLTAIEVTGNRFGLNFPIQFLTGAHTQKMQKFSGLTRHKLFGSGKQRTQKFWRSLGKCLTIEGYLQERPVQHGFGATTELSKKAFNWMKEAKAADKPSMKLDPSHDLLSELRICAAKEALKNRPQIHGVGPGSMASATAAMRALPTSASVTATITASTSSAPPVPEVDPQVAKYQMDLYVRLVKQRNEIAQETGFTPHNIASNKVLLDLARIRPSNLSNMQKIEDLPAAKAERFGLQFLDTITAFCQQYSLPFDQFPTLVLSQKEGMKLEAELSRLTDTQRTSYIMFVMDNKALEEVASLRGLKTSTIVTHLCEALRVGLAVDIRRLGVTPAVEQLITMIIRSPPINNEIYSLTRIKDQLPPHVEYNQIKVVIACLVAQCGQTTNWEGNLVLNPLSTSVIEILDNDDVDGAMATPEKHRPAGSGSAETSSRTSPESKSVIKTLLQADPSKLVKSESSPALGRQPLISSFRHSASQPSSSSSASSQSSGQAAGRQFPSRMATSGAFSAQPRAGGSATSQSEDKGKRKIPEWMTSSKSKPGSVSKKIKSNNLFR